MGELGYELDELDTRAETFLTLFRPRRQDRSPAGPAAVLGTLDTDESSALAPTAALLSTGRPSANDPARVALAVSWFPATSSPRHCMPALPENWDSTNYTYRLERHLYNLTAAAPAELWIAPIQIDTFQHWCHSTGRDPATSSARTGYAAEGTRVGALELIAWPPPLNAPCWCGTGRNTRNAAGIPASDEATRTDRPPFFT